MKKKIKNLEIEISRYVVLSNIEVPENIYNGLQKLYQNEIGIDYNDDESMDAIDWIEANINKYQKIETEEEYKVKDIY